MGYWNKICGFVIIFFIPALFSTAQTVKNSTLFVPANRQIRSTSTFLFPKKEKSNPIPVQPVFNIITSDYYTKHFGLICKKELALQKTMRLLLYIRLGSLQHCNYLEGKRWDMVRFRAFLIYFNSDLFLNKIFRPDCFNLLRLPWRIFLLKNMFTTFV